MKILQVNNVFRTGSTGKIVNDIDVVLKEQNIDSIVCYGRGEIIDEPGIYKFCSEIESNVHHAAVRYLGQLMYGGNMFSTRRLIKIIEKEKPDIVHVHCINGYCVNIYSLFRYLGNKKIKTLITNHSEFYFTGNCGYAFDCKKWKSIPGCGDCEEYRYNTGSYFIDNSRCAWKKMKEAFACFNKNDLIISSVSPWTMSRSLQSPITSGFHHVFVGNGVDTKVFHYVDNHNIIHEKIDKIFRHIVFFSTASFNISPNSIKGGRFVVEVAEKMPDVLFIIAAINNEVPNSLPDNIYLWGKTGTQEELAQLYSAADITLLTSKRETFSMVTAESLCCGTPVVGFLAGGPESIAIPAYTKFVKYGDSEALSNALNNMLKQGEKKMIISNEAVTKYSKERMTAEYISIYNKLKSGVIG